MRSAVISLEGRFLRSCFVRAVRGAHGGQNFTVKLHLAGHIRLDVLSVESKLLFFEESGTRNRLFLYYERLLVPGPRTLRLVLLAELIDLVDAGLHAGRFLVECSTFVLGILPCDLKLVKLDCVCTQGLACLYDHTLLFLILQLQIYLWHD